MPPFPSLTKEWHTKYYPAFNPSKPDLSADGEVVVITGAGGSNGSTIAKAEARKIAVLGHRH